MPSYVNMTPLTFVEPHVQAAGIPQSTQVEEELRTPLPASTVTRPAIMMAEQFEGVSVGDLRRAMFASLMPSYSATALLSAVDV